MKMPEVQPEKPKLMTLCKDNAEKYLELLDYESALFWAEKLTAITLDYENILLPGRYKPFNSTNWLGIYDSLSNDLFNAVNLMVRCYVISGAYGRAIHFINSNRLQMKSRQSFYYLLYSQIKLQDWSNAEHSLQDYDDGLIGPYIDNTGDDMERFLDSRIEHLKAKVYEALEQRETASEYFCTAVAIDKCAMSSLRALSDRQLLNETEIEKFIKETFEDENDEHELMKPIYQREFDKYGKIKYHSNEKLSLLTSSSIDYHLAKVVALSSNHQTASALRLSTNLLNVEPYDPKLLQWHIALLVESDKSIELFKISHRLININPEDWHGWYAAGCYYLSIRKFEKAAELLRKSLTKEPSAGLAYLALGHAFSSEKEHDQAMSAYLTAERVMRGSALPHLYVGLEYGSTGNHDQAESFLRRALDIEPENPLVLHELGTNSYQLGKFESAKEYYEDALQIIELSKTLNESEVVSRWAPLLRNLGNCHRKLGELEKAVSYHRRAMLISSPSAESHSILGFSLALKGDHLEALEQFQFALSLNRHDQFTLEMMKNTIEQVAKNQSYIPSDSDDDEDKYDDKKKSFCTLNRGQMGFPSAASSSTPVMADSSILPIRFNPDNSAPIPSNLSMEDMSIDED